MLAPAWAAVRPIQTVAVWNRSPAGAERLAADLRAQGFAATATTDLPAAVAAADIVSCATLATSPVISGAWLRPGTHLDLIGAYRRRLTGDDPAAQIEAATGRKPGKSAPAA